nr:uncharacterized protein LOC109146501 [Ipomoea batatas]
MALGGIPDHLLRICQNERILLPSIEPKIVPEDVCITEELDPEEHPEVFWMEEIRVTRRRTNGPSNQSRLKTLLRQKSQGEKFSGRRCWSLREPGGQSKPKSRRKVAIEWEGPTESEKSCRPGTYRLGKLPDGQSVQRKWNAMHLKKSFQWQVPTESEKSFACEPTVWKLRTDRLFQRKMECDALEEILSVEGLGF